MSVLLSSRHAIAMLYEDSAKGSSMEEVGGRVGVEDAAGLGVPLLPPFQFPICKVELWSSLTRLP